MNYLIAKAKRVARSQQAEKERALKVNKWSLVRARRQEMLNQQAQLKAKINFVKKWCVQVTLNKMSRNLFSNFDTLRIKVNEYNKKVYSLSHIMSFLKVRIKKKGNTV